MVAVTFAYVRRGRSLEAIDGVLSWQLMFREKRIRLGVARAGSALTDNSHQECSPSSCFGRKAIKSAGASTSPGQVGIARQVTRNAPIRVLKSTGGDLAAFGRKRLFLIGAAVVWPATP